MPGKEYSEEERAQMVGEERLLGRHSISAVARIHKCARSTVRLAIKRDKENGSNTSRKRSGRPPKLGERGLRHVDRLFASNRTLTVQQVAPILSNVDLNVSASTLQRTLPILDLHRRIACKKPLLDSRTIGLRLDWAKNYYDLNWDRTIFVDEASIQLGGQARTWVTRKDGEKYLKECLKPAFPNPKQSFMVWAGVWKGGRTPLVFFDTVRGGSE